MSLPSGHRLGAYEIISLLGAGGMGEVYRARDLRLKRDVALKILPETFASDPDRLVRFEREAELLASLNHPNIAQIHGLEEALVEGAATRALVMELVNGDALDARIARGALPLDEAVAIARQIAEALDAAHERGIVHRDLKPANVMVTDDGRVKVLDFGLAKAVEHAVRPVAINTSVSPTLASPMTGAGVLLGTAAYMSPEQARGTPADRRADIWAFGCVLFEMITGRRAFEGESVADVIVAVMSHEPDLAAISVPQPVAFLIRHCLQKDSRRRLRDIGDAFPLLDASVSDAPVSDAHRQRAGATVWRVLPWAVGVTGVLIGVSGFLLTPSGPSRPPNRLVRLEANAGSDVSLVNDQGPAAAISPDGSLLAFTGRKLGRARQIYVRRLDQLEATPLAGTDDAFMPVFSPDGQWLAFFANGKLRKIPVSGGSAVVLCDAPSGRGVHWGDDGWIVFTPNASPGATIQRVNPNGGAPQPLTHLREGEAAQRFPQMLPGGRGVLYSTADNLGNYNDGHIVVQPLPDGAPKVLIKGGHFGRYVQSGHLTYVHDARLFAVPFDLDRLEVTGPPVPVLERVARSVQNGAAQVDISATGTAVYLADDAGGNQPLQWLARDGGITPLKAVPSNWSNPRISPDGGRIAFDRFDGLQTDIWMYDWRTDAMTQFTFDPSEDWQPVWTPDGGRVVFRSTRQRFAFNLYSQRADGAGQAEGLTELRNPLTPGSWHPSGDILAIVENSPVTNYDIVLLPLSQKGGPPRGAPSPFLNSVAQETSPAFSPDGHWIAYVSNESGRNAVYVRPYPARGGQWLVAQDGAEPTWSQTRHELVYLGPDQRLMVAAYHIEGDSFRAEPGRPWSSSRAVVRTRGMVGFDGRPFDLHPDGLRAIGAWIPESAPVPLQNTLILAFNVFDELRRLTTR